MLRVRRIVKGSDLPLDSVKERVVGQLRAERMAEAVAEVVEHSRVPDGSVVLPRQTLMAWLDGDDAEAVALAEEYTGLLMPDAAMSDQQVKDIVSYLRSKSSATPAGSVEAEVASEDKPAVSTTLASKEEILAGQHYFQGESRLANGGAACNACHDVRNDAVIGGGVLAVELTTAFSRMGSTGMRAILGKAPFPVMQAAYQDKPLTEEEIASLVAFLQYADSEEYNQLPRDYGIGLFLTGTVGAGLMFAFFGVFWRGRKVGSVNQAIYDRQIRSEDLSG